MSFTQISVRRLVLTDAIKEHLNHHSQLLHAMHPSLVNCRVTIDCPQNDSHHDRIYTVRLGVSLLQEELCVVQGQANDLYESIRLVFDRAHQTLKRHSKKYFWQRRSLRTKGRQARADLLHPRVGDGFEFLWRIPES